jgi:tetratricopeptide (TPR) repeat protein
LGILAYSNTFHSTFHFDDFTYIVGNATIRNIYNLQGIWNYYPCRFVTFLSLALNYHFSQLDVIGYHLFNIAVHICSALLVWWLVLLTFSTPAMKMEKISRHANVLALFAGLVFVSHPVQIEAVTYICQRAASMAALFYLTSLCLYIKSRLSQHSVPIRFYYAGSLIAAITAMFTKEIAITLPLMIVLYELCFFENIKTLNWKRIIPFLATLLLIPLTMLLTRSKFFHEIQSIAQGPEGISPMHYLLTQFRVMVTYLRLIFLPLNQNFDYDYPIFKNIFDLPVLSSLLFLLTILFFAKYLFSKYRLVSFSILWFFLALLPESSLLPQKDVIFEHRLYLPLVGFSIFLVSSIYYLLGKNPLRTVVIILTLTVACYSVLTFQRNKLFKNEFTLWNDAVQKSPHKARAFMSRGSEYFQQNRFDLAMSDYNKALEIDPRYLDVYTDRSDIYFHLGKIDQAIEDLNKAIKINPNREEFYFNLGKIYAAQGNYTKAILEFSKSIEINPYRAQSYVNRGESYVKLGNYDQAILDYTRAIGTDPMNAEAYNNRGAVYGSQGDLSDAASDLNKAIEIAPHYTEAYNNLVAVYAQQKKSMGINPTTDKDYFIRGSFYFKQGEFTKAIADFTEAIKKNPKFVQAYNDRGLAYYKEGGYSPAINDYNKAIELNADDADAYYNRGLAFDRQGDQIQALSDFNKAIKINPHDGEIYSNRAIIYYRLKEYDKAWEDVHKAEELAAVVNPQLISALSTTSGKEN